MKKLHTFAFLESPLAGMLRERLAGEGVDCLLRNDQLSSAMGEIPFIECYPELWVLDNEMYPRARLLLDNWLAEQDAGQENWTCPACGEICEGQFNSCWSCERPRE